VEENYCVLCQPTLKASNERIHIQQVMVISISVMEVHGKCMESAWKVEVAVVYYRAPVPIPLQNIAHLYLK